LGAVLGILGVAFVRALLPVRYTATTVTRTC